MVLLQGHNNAITDMKYSSAGDRLLTASMKDGVVRVWSWGKESPIVIDGIPSIIANNEQQAKTTAHKFFNLSQVLIRLTPIGQGETTTVHTSRRKGSSAAAGNAQTVHCDGATWTCDDTKVVTSQSCPARANATDIQPGSQMIYVWDSQSGKCLMGIASSHTSLCSTLVTHPFLPSVVATAGADGVINVWDLDRGERFFTHKNSLLHGPMPTDSTESRGKHCGYLEGQFSPDGLFLIVSDEAGRVTIFDTLLPSKDHGSKNLSLSAPSFMKEQYFANDYYELFYDANGYCIERGSEQPPHLAPKGVRCTHEGVAHLEDVRCTYLDIMGPLPLPENAVRWGRDEVRSRGVAVRMDGGILSHNLSKKATTMADSPGILFGSKTTAIITPDGNLIRPEQKQKLTSDTSSRSSQAAPARSPTNINSANGRTLSNRYRWVDFNDLSDEDDAFAEDDNDEDYTGNYNGRRLNGRRRGPEEEDSSDEDDDSTSPVARTRRSGQRQRGRTSGGRRNPSVLIQNQEQQQITQPSRASSRQTARRTYDEIDSDDEELNQYMSTHTKPSGKFVQDWTESDHFFKMPRGSDEVSRKWLSRYNDPSGSVGMNLFCPQVGDSVVYIPRAHYDTLIVSSSCALSLIMLLSCVSYPTMSYDSSTFLLFRNIQLEVEIKALGDHGRRIHRGRLFAAE